MKYFTLAMLLVIISFKTGLGQRIEINSYYPDVDCPFQFNIILTKTKFRVVEHYFRSDSNLNISALPCTRKEIFDDSGRLVKLIVGPSILNNNINYEVSYGILTDTFCIVTTEYKSHYIDSVSLFQFDTTVNKKYKKYNIFEREKNGNLIVKSTLEFDKGNTIAKKIMRYDKKQNLKVIAYPLGLRIPSRKWIDTLVENGVKSIKYNFIYPENEYYYFEKYSKEGLVLESGYSNYTPNSIPDILKEVYIYSLSSKLLFKYSLNADGKLRQTESYKYRDGNLTEHTIDYNPEDSIINETKKFNEKGQLLESINMSNSQGANDWTYKYIYKNDLLIRTDYYQNKKYFGSSLLKYE